MKKILFCLAVLFATITGASAQSRQPALIEVTGSATINIVPDRITIEIGMEEYYKQRMIGDSVLVRLADIEKDVRKVLHDAGVADKEMVVSDMGNYRNRSLSSNFLMAERLSATLSNFEQIERISGKLDRRGITSFSIVKSDNSDMERYNRQGLKAALDAARQKAQFIAENENLTLLAPYEIEEISNDFGPCQPASNVTFNQGSGMDNFRRIARRYSVKVRYRFQPKGGNFE